MAIQKKRSALFTLAQLMEYGELLYLSLGSNDAQRKEQLAYIISGALEAGSLATFGVVTDKYDKAAFEALPHAERYHTLDNGEVCRHIDYPLSGLAAPLYLRSAETEEERDKLFLLTLDVLKRGLAITSLDHPRHYADLIGDRADFNTYDCIVQCGLLGDIVFG